MDPLRFVVIGLGGYGLVHINAVRWLEGLGLGKLAGVVALDIDRKQRPELARELKAAGCTLYDSVDQFMATDVSRADVLTVPIGINMHVPVSVKALRAGLHVYCEKPAAARVEEVDELIAAERQAQRRVAIGFQHMYSNSIRQLKARICDGRLGPVRSLSLMCGWPRSETYYGRNEWTGKLRVGPAWILDSPANNAHAHYLMNALFLCSPEAGAADTPAELDAELFRANRIEGPDTTVLRFTTHSGANAFVFLTHANSRENGPVMRLVCERGHAYWQTDSGRTIVRYAGGATEAFDNLMHDNWRYEGFRDFVSAVREEREPLSPPRIARAQTLTINMMHDRCPHVGVIPDAAISVVEDWEMFPPGTKGMFHRVKGMDEYMSVAVEERALLRELDVPWAKNGPA
ncbi:MAG TPA: Gfo/Idh/MocA family oxidoreductase [Bacteroidota bacterium]|nr:Gfo/Idh/MocA family oxidoreductase [Bacteroidota bacterium]